MNRSVRLKRKNLISLVWQVNTSRLTLMSGLPKGVTVDMELGTWTFKTQTQEIGSNRNPCVPFTKDPFGVYNRIDIDHLIAMKRDVECFNNGKSQSGD